MRSTITSTNTRRRRWSSNSSSGCCCRISSAAAVEVLAAAKLKHSNKIPLWLLQQRLVAPVTRLISPPTIVVTRSPHGGVLLLNNNKLYYTATTEKAVRTTAISPRRAAFHSSSFPTTATSSAAARVVRCCMRSNMNYWSDCFCSRWTNQQSSQQLKRLCSSTTSHISMEMAATSQASIAATATASIQHQQKAVQLYCDETLYPIGSYSIATFDQAMNLLDLLKARPSPTGSLSSSIPSATITTTTTTLSATTSRVHDALQLLERLVREATYHCNNTSSSNTNIHNNTHNNNNDNNNNNVDPTTTIWYSRLVRMGHPRYFNPIINRWKEISLSSLLLQQHPSSSSALSSPSISTSIVVQLPPRSSSSLSLMHGTQPPPPPSVMSAVVPTLTTPKRTIPPLPAAGNKSSTMIPPPVHSSSAKPSAQLLSPKVIVQWLQRLAIHCSNLSQTTTTTTDRQQQSSSTSSSLFRYDMTTIGMIMQVVIRQSTPQRAPIVAEGLLQLVKQEIAATAAASTEPSIIDNAVADASSTFTTQPPPTPQLKLNARIYGLILSAWVSSGLPETPQRIVQLLDEMDTMQLVPTLITYNIVLRYYTNRGHVESMEQLLSRITAHHKQLSVLSLAQVLYCYTQQQGGGSGYYISRAVQVLEEMLRIRHVGNALDDKAVAESVQNILIAYRQIVMSSASSREIQQQAVRDAQTLVHSIKDKQNVLSPHSLDRVENTLMDIYAQAGMIDQVEAVFASTPNPDIVRCGVLIKAYGNCDRADLATNVVHRILEQQQQEISVLDDIIGNGATPSLSSGEDYGTKNTTPPQQHLPSLNADIFTSLIDAWAESSREDAIQQAMGVLRLMETHEACIARDIRPCVVTFSALLKCISEANRHTTTTTPSTKWNGTAACQQVESILDTMERRYQEGDPMVKPNQISYTLAMKTCFRAGDLVKADAIMKRMELSDTPPDLRTYSEILHHYSQLNTVAAAERCQQILNYMIELSQTTSPLLKPNIYSYSIVLNAWVNSRGESHVVAENMWQIYEQTKRDHVPIDIVFGTCLITYLSKIKTRQSMQRAFDVLLEMERMSGGTVVSATPTTSDHPTLLDMPPRQLSSCQRPGARQYTAVMRGFLAAGDTENATLVVLRFVEAYVNRPPQQPALFDVVGGDSIPGPLSSHVWSSSTTTTSKSSLSGNNSPTQPQQLQQYEYHPRPSMFHAIVAGWIRRGEYIKATLFCEKMTELARNHQIPYGPSLGTYNVLLRHWSDLQAASTAENGNYDSLDNESATVTRNNRAKRSNSNRRNTDSSTPNKTSNVGSRISPSTIEMYTQRIKSHIEKSSSAWQQNQETTLHLNNHNDATERRRTMGRIVQ